MSNPPPAGHVGLSMVPNTHLHIPLDTIIALCLKPRKYLAFLGWCILGLEGFLSDDPAGEELDHDGDLTERGVYHYITTEEQEQDAAVDLEVIKKKSMATATESMATATESRKNFRQELIKCDGSFCVFTGLDPDLSSGMHIIPHARGSEWLRIVISGRPKQQEDGADVEDINDIRNGIFASLHIHTKFDARQMAILKTPNPFLATSDIPPRATSFPLGDAVAYPEGERYTLQWLRKPSPSDLSFIAKNNTDAAFLKGQHLPKPSGLLLHYVYGAAALKQWGKDTQALVNRPNIPRPKKPVSMPAMGPPTNPHDRTVTIKNRSEAGPVDEGDGRNDPAGKYAQMLGLEVPPAELIVASFWLNSPAARERRHKEEKEKTDYVERWREGVLPASH